MAYTLCIHNSNLAKWLQQISFRNTEGTIFETEIMVQAVNKELQGSLSNIERKALEETIPLLHKLLKQIGCKNVIFSGITDPFLQGALERAKNGSIIRKRFGESLILFTFMNVRDKSGGVLRVICFVDPQGNVKKLSHNFLSPEQARLVKDA